MHRYDVLKRDCPIDRHMLIEASAGTGKTFSMAHLFVRLLLEEPQKEVDEILVVTFTRKATTELKARIRKFLQEHLVALEEGIILTDYMQMHSPEKAIPLLKKALYSWDKLQVLTIHGFAERILSRCASLKDEKELLVSGEVQAAIHDFMLSELPKELFSESQLQILLSRYKQSVEDLKKDVALEVLKKGDEILFERHVDLYQEFVRSFPRLSLELKKLLEDYESLLKRYKKPKFEEDLFRRFCAHLQKGEPTREFFELLIAEDLVWCTAFSPENLRAKPKEVTLHYPNLCDTLKDSIGEVVRKARDPNHLYAGVVRLAKEHLKRYKESRRRSTHDDALLELYAALKDPETLEKIRGCFKAVLIDEFQDTDVLQWDLFKTLFYDDPQMRATLTLVGDPKQSIYAFREGDVYTYLNAVETLGKENAATLNTNWRSQKGLVECLNALFDSRAFPSLLELPRLNKSLEVPPVCSGRKESASVDDEKGAVHFLEVEPEKEVEELLLDKISSEILRLEGDRGVPFSSWAILVSDKNQSQKAVSRLKSYGIPVIAQKKGKLHETEGYSSVLQLLTLLSDPVSLGALKAFLGASMIGWSASEICALQDEDSLFEVSKTVGALREIALKSGFGRCFEEFLLSDFGGRRPVDLLQREPLLLAEMRQVVDLLMGEEREKMLSLGALKNRLEDLERVSSFAEDEMQVRQIAGQNAVQVLTIHTSKGLEFDYVFPLGLVTGRKPVDKLIPTALEGKRVWTWNGFDEEESEKHFQELEAEKLRLLYVAFTRAKERLYVPWVISEKPNDCSAIKLYSARYQGKEDFRTYAVSAGCSWERVSESKEGSLTPPLDLLEERLCLKAPSIARSEIALDSFTSLTKDLARIHQSDCPQDALPAGRLTGIVIHKLMEKLDFHAPTEEHLDQLMRQYVAKSPLEGFEEHLKEMLKRTTHVPLKAATETFTLGSLSASHLLREPEFLYNEERSSFIRGAIDCICFTGQKYYLVDWKSNLLDSYDKKRLAEEMEAAHYLLQVKLYRIALERYLRYFDQRPFEEIYGGAFYLFLRGIDETGEFGVHYEP